MTRGSFTMNDGLLDAYANGIYMDANGPTVTINGGEIKVSTNTGINNRDGKVVINGGRIDVTGSNGVTNYGEVEMNGGEINVGASNGIYTYEGGSVKMTGGEIYADSYLGVRNYGDLTVSGGKITAYSFTIGNYANFDLSGGEITAQDGIAVSNQVDSTMTFSDGFVQTLGIDDAIVLSKPGAKLTMTGGKVEALAYELDPSTGLPKYGGTGIGAFKDTEMTISGGEVIASSFALYGNGSNDGGSNDGLNAKFNISGGKFTSKDHTAFYYPTYNGEANISGGKFYSAEGAIEVRGGTMNITGGEFYSDIDEIRSVSNTNGTTSKGSAIAIAQHTTRDDINVYICGGIFDGARALSEMNTQSNPDEDVAKIKIEIDEPCGELRFISDDEQTVYIQDFEVMGGEGFIKGGLYSYSVADYLADGYGEKIEQGMYGVHKWHNISINTPRYGETGLSATRAMAGDEITITANPENDAELIVLEAKDTESQDASIDSQVLTMPDDDVTVRAQFAKFTVDEADSDDTTPTSGVSDRSNAQKVIARALRSNPTLMQAVSGIDPLVELTVNDADTNKDEQDDILAESPVEGAKFVGSHNINIVVSDDGDNKIGEIAELPDPITVAIALPSDLANVEDGYERKFYVVGENAVIPASSEDGKAITFEMQKAGEYAVIYADVKIETPVESDDVESPNTGDNIAIYVAGFALFAGAGVAISRRKR